MNRIHVVTTDAELARRVANAFHALTGYSSSSHKENKLFLIETTPTETVSSTLLKNIARGVVRDDDIALIF